MAKRKKRSKTLSREKKSSKGQTLAIIALILNILILPGLGSLIAGKTKEGIWQIILVILSIITWFILIGIPIFIVSWVWGLITGIKLVQKSN
ncbi:MAG: hypothetical protein AABY10_02170 [Nanoarchaeota archaeon]